MRILISPDSYKGTLTAGEAASILAEGLKEILPEVSTVQIPLGDGGEGTLCAMLDAVGGTKHPEKVLDPLGREICSEIAVLSSGSAFVEMARASGLILLSRQELNPLECSSWGTGQLLNAARRRSSRIIVGIGGSATVDGGLGMARALGVRFIDRYGDEVPPSGRGLSRIHSIDLSGFHPGWKDTIVEVMCDVNNPLTGSQGAARIFGPQKGANECQVELLERGLESLGEILNCLVGEDVTSYPGAGAAGGVGAMLKALLNAELLSGAELAVKVSGFEQLLETDRIDLVLTGEGLLDSQTLAGKLPIIVAKRAKAAGIPVAAVPGSVSKDDANRLFERFDYIIPASDSSEPPISTQQAEADLKNAAYCLAHRLRCRL